MEVSQDNHQDASLTLKSPQNLENHERNERTQSTENLISLLNFDPDCGRKHFLTRFPHILYFPTNLKIS